MFKPERRRHQPKEARPRPRGARGAVRGNPLPGARVRWVWHEALGAPLDASKLTSYARQAYKRAALDKPVRPWHGLRHTALTETAAADVPAMYVQAKAGHAQGSTTERSLHAAKTAYPDAAELAEARLFG